MIHQEAGISIDAATERNAPENEDKKEEETNPRNALRQEYDSNRARNPFAGADGEPLENKNQWQDNVGF